MQNMCGPDQFRRGTRARRERGAALVELALTLPLLVLLVVGTLDFGRVFRTTMVVTNAARAGAQFGAQTLTNSANTGSMVTRATEVLTANALSGGAAPTAVRTCSCVNDNGVTVTANVACNTTCASSHMVVDVTVTATRTFSLLAPYPGIPTSVTIARSHTMRAE